MIQTDRCCSPEQGRNAQSRPMHRDGKVICEAQVQELFYSSLERLRMHALFVLVVTNKQ